MHRRQTLAGTWASLTCMAFLGCSGGGGGTVSSPPQSACDGCSWFLREASLRPSSMASDDSFVYLLKSLTNEVVRVPVGGGTASLVTDEVADANALLLVNGQLWLRAYQGHLYRIDLSTGGADHLVQLEGLFDIRGGPSGLPVASRQSNGQMEVLSLAMDGSSDSPPLWSQSGSSYFADFAAGPDGIAWIASTSLTDVLYYLPSGASSPLSFDVRPQRPIAGSLTVAFGTANFLGTDETAATALYDLTGNAVTRRVSAPNAMQLLPLTDTFVTTATNYLSIGVLDRDSGVRATMAFTEQLNIFPAADSRCVYLPFKAAIATIPRSGVWQ
jgi:hypothetical protein